jgi:YbgC/YbaW family acyl-CoA thioester hydrolase
VPFEFKLIRQVEFPDTDMAGIVHFSAFFRYMEAAEHAFFRSLGLSIVTKGFDPPIGWPRVHAACDYKSPLHFEDRFEIHLIVKERLEKRIRYGFLFRALDEESPREIARGELVVACVSKTGGNGAMRSVPIPEPIAAMIERAPAELLESCL